MFKGRSGGDEVFQNAAGVTSTLFQQMDRRCEDGADENETNRDGIDGFFQKAEIHGDDEGK
jgi:hypothetical protein